MSTTIPAKSILKQGVRKAPTVTDEQKAKTEKDRKNLNIALKHAYLIQHRKDVEAAISNSIIDLIDIPAASAFTSQEARKFLTHLTSFQPSDFDSLVEERGIDGKCGYVLCRNAPRAKTMGRAAEWKLKKGMGDWCSNDCAKKALYVKTQLSEVPAWERVPQQQPTLQLHQDDRPPEDDPVTRRANRTARVDEWRQKVANDEELAMERGEKPTSFRPTQVMADQIIEKRPGSSKPSAPGFDVGQYDSIEGHQPKPLRKSQQTLPEDSEEEDEDQDEDGNHEDGEGGYDDDGDED